jgi:dihydrofolate synthase/folylpolyglutamate synthase
VTLHGVPIQNHVHHSPAALAAAARDQGMRGLVADSVPEALSWIARHEDRRQPPFVLILGSLYLAGEVLRQNGQMPS